MKQLKDALLFGIVALATILALSGIAKSFNVFLDMLANLKYLAQ